jgi:hypothetical protein
MALILKDRVQETSTTTGTGTLTLAGAVTQFQTFSAAVGNGNTTYYTIYNAGGSDWEVGLGTVGAGTLARTTVLASSNAGAAVNFTGTLYVFGDYPAGKAVFQDASGVINNPTFNATTSVITPIVQATNSGGLALKNSAGTTQISMGAGGGDNVSVSVSTNLNGANAQIDISPTGTGHVHIKPTGTGSLEIAPTSVGTINNMTIGATTAVAGSFTNLSVTGTTAFDGAEGTAGQVLTSAGTGNTPTWATPTTGTVTSVAATVPSFLSVAGSPITSSGTLALSYSGTALPAANGGTGLTSPGTNGNVLTSNGTAWVSQAVTPTGSTYTRTSFTATGGQTSFTVTYTVGFVEVFLNGVLLNASDYTASSGTAVVLAVGATAGDIVETIAYNTTSVGTASTATNIAGGIASQIPYQTGAGATAFIPNGTAGQLLQSNGTSAPTWVAAPTGGFTLGTPVATTSGTSIDIVGIPAGVKQIVLSFNGVSTSGTSIKSIRIGDSGGIETTGYDATGASMTSSAQDVNVSTAGYIVHSEQANHILVGSATLTLENSSTNTWALTGNFSDSGTGRVFASSGIKSLSAVLDRIRLTTNNGTDTFDAGEINIAYI